MSNFFLSIAENIKTDNKKFQEELDYKLNENVCELIAPYSTTKEVKICNLQLK